MVVGGVMDRAGPHEAVGVGVDVMQHYSPHRRRPGIYVERDGVTGYPLFVTVTAVAVGVGRNIHPAVGSAVSHR